MHRVEFVPRFLELFMLILSENARDSQNKCRNSLQMILFIHNNDSRHPSRNYPRLGKNAILSYYCKLPVLCSEYSLQMRENAQVCWEIGEYQ